MSSGDTKSFICTEGGKHNRTPTQAHTSRYSLYLRHVLESVGLHRRYSLRRKIQRTSLCGAGACADERRTAVVAAEGAVAKGHCPRLGLDAGRQKPASRAQQLIPIKINRPVAKRYDRVCARVSVCVQMKLPVSRRNSELGRQLYGVLKKKLNIYIHTHRHKSMHVGMFVYKERERVSVTLVTTANQACPSDLCTCVHTRMCAGTILLISLLCRFVCRCTP
jgi:hypothetical protein